MGIASRFGIPSYPDEVTSFGVSKIVTTAMLSFVLVCSACASPGFRTAVPAGNPAAPAHGSPSSGPADIKEKVAKPLDREALPTYRPVVRDGLQQKRSVAAKAGRLSKAASVRYPDGVVLTVKRIAKGVEKEQGPGAFPGRPYTAISIVIENRSTKVINLSQVVVSATYGSAPARVAAPVYAGSASKEFSGALAPGGTDSAQFAFAIPNGKSTKVVLTVDFDDVHHPATFAGVAG